MVVWTCIACTDLEIVQDLSSDTHRSVDVYKGDVDSIITLMHGYLICKELAKMRSIELNHYFVVLILLSVLILGKAEIYIVTVEGEPVISYKGGVNGFEATAVESDSDEKIDVTRLGQTVGSHKSDMVKLLKVKVPHLCDLVISYARHLEKRHDMLLDMLFEEGTYKKLYSYRHLINGFAVHTTPSRYAQTSAWREVSGKRLESEETHDPHAAIFGLPTEYGPLEVDLIELERILGKCEVDRETKRDYCNGKIIGAQHFAEAAKTAGAFNPDIDFDSPLDGDGHGSHTAAIAAGNNGISVRMHGFEFGRASGMAPVLGEVLIAVYKALYRIFGGFVADVVAAIDQAVHDGVDILNLSVGPNSPPATTKTTYLNPFDATLLAAVKAGVFVVQAAGNGGPFPKTLLSYSPWIATVAAAVDDRRYKNHFTLGNGKILAGLGLSPATHTNRTFTLVAANDVLLDSSVAKYSPSDCQRPEVLNKNLVQGNILLCGYSFNFVVGTASIKKVSQTAKSLGAAGFVLAVENASPGTKFDPVPVGIPGILITDVSKSTDLIDYYNMSTPRDWTGRVKSFKAVGSIGEGEGFAMISGTSMAAPHIAGIAALVKQKNPHWSPAAIKSALMTTSTTVDRAERPLQAQQYSGSETMSLVPATPFDYGSGHVNPRAALDPGLIFDAAEETYVITARMAPAVAIETNPPAMTLRPGASRKFSITLTVRSVTGTYSFGEVLLKGSRGHKVRIPVVAMGYDR
ncbi:hypothetical protein DH2020_039645 [Rehmannia glutinosa]|uniref:Uncharacterized protein n=1 Tax=Rehmannia glutinosa TaxID=99300 RepID=A0ABR0UWD4_REHGL